MALDVPDNVEQAMKDAKLAGERLTAMVMANPSAWSKEQKEQMAAIFDMIKNTHAALRRLINANQG